MYMDDNYKHTEPQLPILKKRQGSRRPSTTAGHQEGSAGGVQHSARPSPCCCFFPNKLHSPGGSRQLHRAPDGLFQLIHDRQVQGGSSRHATPAAVVNICASHASLGVWDNSTLTSTQMQFC